MLVTNYILIVDEFRSQFFRSISDSLLDFCELSPLSPLQSLLEVLVSAFLSGVATILT